ncbi:MAG: TIM barrel protein, partial [Clostridia bacterium]
KGAPIFTDTEFVDFVNSNALSALVDVGHMNLNGYDYEFVVSALGNRIKAFHIHNNDGVSDLHDKIARGSFDFVRFAALFKRFTPTADLVFEYIDVPDLTIDELIADVAWGSDINRKRPTTGVELLF